MYLDYDENDPLAQRWQWGMNTAHVSGMTPSCRAPMLKWLAEYARRFVYGSGEAIGTKEVFQATSPFTPRCLEHLGRRQWQRAKRAKRSQRSDRTPPAAEEGYAGSARPRPARRGAGRPRQPAPMWAPAPFGPSPSERAAELASQFWDYQPSAADVASPTAFAERWTTMRQRRPQVGAAVRPAPSPPVAVATTETSTTNNTAASSFPGEDAEDVAAQLVGPLVEIVSSLLPDLLAAHELELRAGDGPTMRLDLEVNLTAASPGATAPRGGEEPAECCAPAAMNLSVAISPGGDYEFLTKLGNSSRNTVNHRSLRLRSGKAALTLGARNLSLAFAAPPRGAGVMFSYAWADEARNATTPDGAIGNAHS